MNLKSGVFIFFFSIVVFVLPACSQEKNSFSASSGDFPSQEINNTAPSIVESSDNGEATQIPQVSAKNVDIVPQEIVEIPEAPKETSESIVEESEVVTFDQMLSKDLVQLAWEASGKRQEEKLNTIIAACIDGYQAEADTQQSQIVDFPDRAEMNAYQSLNDVATCLFIKSEFLMNSGKTQKAIHSFEDLIKRYPLAKAWDPRGWYWSISEKSQASIDVLTGKVQDELDQHRVLAEQTKPSIHFEGKSKIVDYTKYGEFKNVGTVDYHYEIKDVLGLARAVGEGIYPNSADVYNNPRFKAMKEEGLLKGKHWDYVNTDDLEAAYFKWATAPEPPGVRLFYIGNVFEKAGMLYEALRAYHALIVHFPKTVAWTYWQTPWYPAQAAVAKIRHIIRIHPEMKLSVKDMDIVIRNGFDNDTSNDLISTIPGSIEKGNTVNVKKEKFDLGSKVELTGIKQKLGEGKVRLVQYNNGHWQMLVNDKPFPLHGITYAPTKIGQSPDKGTLANWMEEDTNENGRIDGPFDSWVDKNKNNKQDSDELVVGDFQLMKEMGVNAIRIYHDPELPNKALLREMNEKYGIYVIIGDFLGKYAIGSGADWSSGTDYENEEHQKNMMSAVQKMVMEYKDEPYVLLWLLGNENNYGVASNADKKPAAFFKFADKVAQWIKSVDPNHPVAISNGDTLFLDVFAENAPNIDIFTANVYRGDYGFGSFWQQVKDATDKPAFITEYGAPAYAPQLTLEDAEKAQADYHQGNWLDIQQNMAGYKRGVGNALGGVVFEWMDEWWKNYEPYLHDRKSDAVGPFPGGYYFEEWFGIVGQGNGQRSPFLRQLRKTYFLYKELWN